MFKIFFWTFTSPMYTQLFLSSTNAVFWPSTIPGNVFSKCAFYDVLFFLQETSVSTWLYGSIALTYEAGFDLH